MLQGPQNYLEWASGMCSLLMVFGVWQYANTNVAAHAAAADVPAHKKNQDQCLRLITSFLSGVIRQNYMNEGNPNTVWEASAPHMELQVLPESLWSSKR